LRYGEEGGELYKFLPREGNTFLGERRKGIEGAFDQKERIFLFFIRRKKKKKKKNKLPDAPLQEEKLVEV